MISNKQCAEAMCAQTVMLDGTVQCTCIYMYV